MARHGKARKNPKNHVPRAKSKADDVYNLRKRLKRRLANARAKGLEGEANYLAKLVQDTYARKQGGKGRARIDYGRIPDIYSKLSSYNDRKKNGIRSEDAKRLESILDKLNPSRVLGFERRAAEEKAEAPKDIPGSKTGEPFEDVEEYWRRSIPKSLTDAQRHGLFAATSNIWEGHWGDREEFLIQELGVDSLEEAWAKMVAPFEREDDINAASLAAGELYDWINSLFHIKR